MPSYNDNSGKPEDGPSPGNRAQRRAAQGKGKHKSQWQPWRPGGPGRPPKDRVVLLRAPLAPESTSNPPITPQSPHTGSGENVGGLTVDDAPDATLAFGQEGAKDDPVFVAADDLDRQAHAPASGGASGLFDREHMASDLAAGESNAARVFPLDVPPAGTQDTEGGAAGAQARIRLTAKDRKRAEHLTQLWALVGMGMMVRDPFDGGLVLASAPDRARELVLVAKEVPWLGTAIDMLATDSTIIAAMMGHVGMFTVIGIHHGVVPPRFALAFGRDPSQIPVVSMPPRQPRPPRAPRRQGRPMGWSVLRRSDGTHPSPSEAASQAAQPSPAPYPVPSGGPTGEGLGMPVTRPRVDPQALLSLRPEEP